MKGKSRSTFALARRPVVVRIRLLDCFRSLFGGFMLVVLCWRGRKKTRVEIQSNRSATYGRGVGKVHGSGRFCLSSHHNSSIPTTQLGFGEPSAMALIFGSERNWGCGFSFPRGVWYTIWGRNLGGVRGPRGKQTDVCLWKKFFCCWLVLSNCAPFFGLDCLCNA